MTGYPHDLAGGPADAPAVVATRVLAMAAKSHARYLAAHAEQLRAAPAYRRARALDVLVAEANATAPARNKASDGWIGDARHQAEGTASQHNPDAHGIVRAQDLTNDPALDLPAVAERIRAAAAAGRLPQVAHGGYAILAGRITAPDWSGWRVYTGADPHVSHLHVTAADDPAGYDSTAPWGVFDAAQPVPPPAPVPAPAPPAAPGWTGPDLAGAGAALRGDTGNNGPRVAALQAFLNRYAPAYSALVVDGWWGPATSAVVAEFGHRSGIPSADGANIGPRLAAALAAAGLTLPAAAGHDAAVPPPAPVPARPSSARPSSARDRVRAHLARRA